MCLPLIDFQGKGEQNSSNSFYNLGEAEYLVAVYQYMRLLGYPAERITILAAYSDQKNLITDIIAQRCKKSLFGKIKGIRNIKLILYRESQNCDDN